MINSAYTPDIYTGNGVATSFAYGNKITHKNQLRVTLHEIATGDEEILVVDTDYEVSGVGEDSGGNVTYSVSDPMASTHKLIIERATPILQETDFEEQGGFHAATHEDAFDKLTAVAQEKEESDSRAPKFSTVSGLSNVILPTPESGKYLRGNATNDGYENAESVDVGEAVLSSAEPTALTASATGAAGSSSDISKADHRHGMPLAGALDWTGIHTHTKIQKWAKGADIAPSANVLTPGNDGNYFDVTGVAGFTSIATKGAGTVIKLHFDAALTITHHATDLILPGGASITTAAGDEAEFVEYATGDWRCTSYTKANGQAISESLSSTVMLVDTTVNFTSSMTAAQIQALIDAVPKDLNSKTVTFQFADGTYTLTAALTFANFSNGRVNIYGNTGENHLALHTNQAVYLNFSASAVNGVNINRCGYGFMHNLRVSVANNQQAVVASGGQNFFVQGCYLQAAGTGNYLTQFSQGFYTAKHNYVSQGSIGIVAVNARLDSEGNDDTGTAPVYGLGAYAASTIGKNGTQPSGSTGAEITGTGGVIR